jgi:hypothetical protein
MAIAPWLLVALVGCGSSSSSGGGTPDTSDASASGGAPTDASGPPNGTNLDGGSGTPAIVDVASSGGQACAVSADGRLRCWGDNSQGQLGDGSTNPHAVPTDVPGVTGAIAVSAKGSHTCAVVAGGAVVGPASSVGCWARRPRRSLACRNPP